MMSLLKGALIMKDFILRKWQYDDAENISIVANNPNIAKNLRNAFPYPYTIDDAKWYVNNCISKEGKSKSQEQLWWMGKLLVVLEYLLRMMFMRNLPNWDIGLQKIIGVKGLHQEQ